VTSLEAVPPPRAADPPEAPPATRVLIADRQALVSAGFRVLLEAEHDLAVVAEAGSGDEALELIRSTRPDVVLVDLSLPGTDGVETTRLITSDPSLGQVKVLVLAVGAAGDDILAALRAGASGVLLKSTDAAELVRGVRAVADGHASLSPKLTSRLIAELTRLPESGLPSTELLDELTDREREVVALVAHGLTNDQIAERLVVSPATAKTHVSRSMVKLQARDRAQLVVLAYDAGLVRPPEYAQESPPGGRQSASR
jgi:DNA-binding NarL/FixJ family response regulator